MEKRKIFIEGNNPTSRAYIGWQDKELSLYGAKEGYKKSADDLIDIALKRGLEGRIDILDTYIFPIMHSYRHSIEVSLKLIYNRTYGEIPSGGHDLIDIWDKSIVGKVINDLGLKIEEKEISEIRQLIKELQGKDSKADVWRYLINKKGSIYFTEWEFIDYVNLKESVNYLYDFLDGVYYYVDDVLSSN
ncbi:MAG: hypothetical protein E6929_07725 [Clostridium sp.]|nr:hypothetical protein [Clostridium sp.]